MYFYPSELKFKIEFARPGEGETVNFQIFTLLGELVATPAVTGSEVIEVDLSSQKPGIYMIRMVRGEKSEYQKVVRY